MSPDGFNGQGVAHAHGVAPVGCRAGGGRAAAQRLRRRLPRTEATPEGVEELSFLVAECHSPGDAGCSEEEDEGWSDCRSPALTCSAVNYARRDGRHRCPCRTAYTLHVHSMRGNRGRHRRDSTQRRHRVEGGAWKPTQFQVLRHPRHEVGVVDAAVDYDAQTVDQASGARPTEATRAAVASEFQLWRRSSWWMDGRRMDRARHGSQHAAARGPGRRSHAHPLAHWQPAMPSARPPAGVNAVIVVEGQGQRDSGPPATDSDSRLATPSASHGIHRRSGTPGARRAAAGSATR